jgi:hypothetical protein
VSREWKPGDVAVSEIKGKSFVVFRAEDPDSREDRWYDKFGRLLPDDQWLSQPKLRPLIVIDPEDREQAERLDKAIRSAYSKADVLDPDETGKMQAALREFANPTPPKPDEPTGLGAVVEDAEGARWVLSHEHLSDAPWTRPHLNGTYAYKQIAAVRVLSEGVST